jgi:hypothetical protein
MKEKGIDVVSFDLKETQIPATHRRLVAGVHRIKGPGELSAEMRQLLHQASLVILFCTPYALQVIDNQNVLIAYENDPDAEEAAFDALQGRLHPSGSLPVMKFYNKSGEK